MWKEKEGLELGIKNSWWVEKEAWEVRAVCVGLKKMHTPVPTWDGCTWLSEVRQYTGGVLCAVCHCLGDCGLYLSVERIT